MSKELINTIVPEEISCEYSRDPLGIQTAKPRLSWLLRSDAKGQIQTAYQVLVAGSMENLVKDTGDKWNSGKVGSDKSVNVVYIEGFFYNTLAGIKGADYYGNNGTAGFKEINIKPCIPGDLTNAAASIKTIRGMVSSAWEKRDNALNLKVTIPVNSTAKISIPKMGALNITVFHNSQPIWVQDHFQEGADGINAADQETDYINIYLGSGSYEFNAVAQFPSHRNLP